MRTEALGSKDLDAVEVNLLLLHINYTFELALTMYDCRKPLDTLSM